jgi:hypothetical protein
MILVLLVICVIAFLFSLMIALTEAVQERDWPRDTGWYPVAFLFASIFLISSAI